MKEYICEVVPVYVRPQPVTDEKACVGLIVRCPDADYAGYRLVGADEAAFDRIVRFFPRFGRENLLRAINWSKSDIEYSISKSGAGNDDERFSNLIRPRENVVQYGAPQISVTTRPQEEASRIYETIIA